METYNRLAARAAADVTKSYSTSFSLACQLFPPLMRQQIYNVYGLVRLADEVVDTYRGEGQADILDALEADTYASLKRGYSSNILVHAYIQTAAAVGIDLGLIKPFFDSMRQDIIRTSYDATGLGEYVYGSAEVIGLMCLRVFTAAEPALYEALKPGAQSLGAAFQKVNFLRDLAADHNELGRTYFPEVNWDAFDDEAKRRIEVDIAADFAAADTAIMQLPTAARPPVRAAYRYYLALFNRIQKISAVQLKTGRVRLPNAQKLLILGQTAAAARLSRTRKLATS